MADIEPLKPSNTGWLVADVVPDTFASGWTRTEVDPDLLALLANPEWEPYLVFPGEYMAGDRVVTKVHTSTNKRPLFILLDATWPEARKMFRKSPYLDHLPVLKVQSGQRGQSGQSGNLSNYKLRRSQQDAHFCTVEVAALCMALIGEAKAARTLEAYLDVFTHHYLQARQQLLPDLQSAAHQRLLSLQLQQL